MTKRTLNRQDATALQCWHPDGTPFSDADYEAANLPVPTPELLAHWARMNERSKRLGDRYDLD